MASFNNHDLVSNQASTQHIYGNAYFDGQPRSTDRQLPSRNSNSNIFSGSDNGGQQTGNNYGNITNNFGPVQDGSNSFSTRRYFELPAIDVTQFFGREKVLEEIKNVFAVAENQETIGKVILRAMGGQGKSQTALKFCKQSEKRYRGVFWIDASSKTSVENGLGSVCEILNGNSSQGLDQSTKVKSILRTLQEWNKSWLLVYDNFDEPTAFNLRNYMPNRGRGSIIITTRNKATGRLGHLIELPSMINDYGVELLLRHLPENEFEEHKASGSKIVQLLGGLALALDQASAYLSFGQIDPAEFIVRYKKQRKEILEYIPKELWEYKNPNDEQSLSVFTTWELSWKQMSHDGEDHGDYIGQFLTISAFLEPTNISEYIFKAYVEKQTTEAEEQATKVAWTDIFISLGHEDDVLYNGIDASEGTQQNTWDGDKFWKVIAELDKLSLIQSIDRQPLMAFTLHPLIRDWLQLRQKREKMQCLADETATILASGIECSSNQSNTTIQQELITHVDSFLSSTRALKITCGLGQGSMRKETQAIGQLCRDHGRHQASVDLFLHLLEDDQKNYPAESISILNTMDDLGYSLWSQGRWEEAEKLNLQLLESSLRVLGPEHPDTLNRQGNLASTYRDQGRWEEAEKLDVQVLGSRRRVLGPEHPDTLGSQANLASTYRNQGRWEEAEKLDVQVLGSSLRVLGPEHPDTLASQANLASTYWNQGRWEEAEELEVQVLESTRRVLGPEHPHTLSSQADLASTYRDQGRWEEAEKLEVQVLESRRRVLGPEHPDTLTSQANLASTYRKQGRWEEAEELEVQVLESSLRVLGPEHPDTLASQANLASTYRDQGRWEEAEKLEVQVLESRRRVLGPEHPDTLTSQANLASTYKDQGRWEEAEELEVQVLESRRRVLGPEHPDTLASQANSASTYWNQGRWEEAEKLEVQVLESRRRVLGPEHPDTLLSMNNLAWTLKDLHRDDKAMDLLDACVKLSFKVLGPKHFDTKDRLHNLKSWRSSKQASMTAESSNQCVASTRISEQIKDNCKPIAGLSTDNEELETVTHEERQNMRGREL